MGNMILVDGNSIGYAAHSARELKQNGRQVQAIFFSLKMIKSAIAKFGDQFDELVVLWDTRAVWRYDIYPEYKGKRDDDPAKRESRKAYKEQTPLIRKGLSLLGVEQRIAKNEEADDLAAAIVHNKQPGQKILLVSGDKDWLQLIGPEVTWYDPREDGRLVTIGDFAEKTGYASPVLFSQAKAILGDTSDNIKGVDGVGEKCLTLLLKHYGSIPKFIQSANAHQDTARRGFEKGDLPDDLNRWRGKLNDFAFGDGLNVFKRNMQLMNLLSKRHRSTEILEKIVTMPGAFDEKGFVDFCHEFAFLSIANNIRDWRASFAKFATKQEELA